MTVDPIYDRGYHSLRHAELLVNDEYFWARAEASIQLYFSEQERRKSIFEFGCGIGQQLACLPNAAGWDVSSEAREACSRRKIKVYDDFPDVPRQSWDIVFCRHVLEHLEDPLLALRSLRDLVKPGGELYLVLPVERHYTCSFEPDLNQHLYCWNFRTIDNLINRAGMHVYANTYTHVLGYRALLPVRRTLGKRAYFWATRITGVLKHNAELIVRARVIVPGP